MVDPSRRILFSDEEIISRYRELKSIPKLAKEFRIGHSTIQLVLRRNDEKRIGIEFRRKFIGQEKEIREAYEAGFTMEELCELFGRATHTSFKNAVTRAGGLIRDNPIPTLKFGELERIKELQDAGHGQMAIGVMIGRSQSFVSAEMRRNGINRPKVIGADHPNWKGGRIRCGKYIKIKINPDDPLFIMTDLHFYALEHRIILARHLGRVLKRSESVHHIDGDTENNNLENLQLRQGKHGKGIVMRCLDCSSKNVASIPIGDT